MTTLSKTFVFIFILCTSCALILSILAETLRTPQKNAKELYRSKQLLLASRILNYDGTFLLENSPAIYDPNQKRLAFFKGSSPPKAKGNEILAVYYQRVEARLTTSDGNLLTFEEAGLDEKEYLETHAKLGYAKLPYKLVYVIKKNAPSNTFYGYVIPVNGFGVWDAIYGYLGVAAGGDRVLGMTWYEQKETPGLGGEIALPEWQKQFENKLLFQESPDGTTDFARAPLGIQVVRGTVEEQYGDSPLAKSAVDGIAGASITVNGVNEALRSSLAPYRPFLLKRKNNEAP